LTVKNKIFRSIYPNQVAHDLGKKKISPFVARSLVFIKVFIKMFGIAFQKCFKNLKFFLLEINMFFIFLYYFDVLISKIIFKK